MPTYAKSYTNKQLTLYKGFEWPSTIVSLIFYVYLSFYAIKTLKWGNHTIKVHGHKPCRVEIYMFMDPNYP